MDMYHLYSLLEAREVMVPILPLGQKMQLMPVKNAAKAIMQHKKKHKIERERASAGCTSTGPCAQPTCSMCCVLRPPSPADVHHMLRGRNSPVRNALQDCWIQAARELEDDTVISSRGYQQGSDGGSSAHQLQQERLLLTLEALDLAAERLRAKLSAAQTVTATAETAEEDPGLSPPRRSSMASKRRPSTASAARRSSCSSISPRRHWIP